MEGHTPVTPGRATASPRTRASVTPGGAAGATPEADEKYLAYMKALRMGRQKARAGLGSAKSSPALPKSVGAGSAGLSGVKPDKRPTPATKVAGTKGTSIITPVKSTGAIPLALQSFSGTLAPANSSQDGNPHVELHASAAPQRPDSPHSDSSDSIDFEVRSVGHVRSVKKYSASISAKAGAEAIAPNAALEIKQLHGYVLIARLQNSPPY